METKLETSAKGFHCFESEKLSLPKNYYSTEIPKFQDVRAFLRFTDCPKGNQEKMLISKLRFAKIYHDSGRANRLPCRLRELRYT